MRLEMSEADSWVNLEFRVSGEFAGLPERRPQYFWCDGFTPDEYVLNGPRPRITGKAWIVDGQKQMLWDFTLLLPSAIDSRAEIDWASLLPAKDMTRWMAFDATRRYIEIEPAVAVPDIRQSGG